ncbi:MAG: hypothetical protein IKP88_10995 [Lachnospiraceae bacterium]|nr:hypothetical protein [Lachnospiraceae bacterium]
MIVIDGESNFKKGEIYSCDKVGVRRIFSGFSYPTELDLDLFVYTDKKLIKCGWFNESTTRIYLYKLVKNQFVVYAQENLEYFGDEDKLVHTYLIKGKTTTKSKYVKYLNKAIGKSKGINLATLGYSVYGK